MKISDRKGFTLVELLVVIAIIGILAVVAVPSLIKNINKAKISKLKADINALELAIKSFYLENDRLPCTGLDYDGVDMEELLGNLDAEYPYISPFGENYDIRCIHESDGDKQPVNHNNPVVRIDVGGFTVEQSVADLIEVDAFFDREGVVTSLRIGEGSDEENGGKQNKPTLWIMLDIIK